MHAHTAALKFMYIASQADNVWMSLYAQDCALFLRGTIYHQNNSPLSYGMEAAVSYAQCMFLGAQALNQKGELFSAGILCRKALEILEKQDGHEQTQPTGTG